MPARDRIAPVVLAAGRSVRFGSAKLLAPYRGRPLLWHALDTVAASRRAGLLCGGVLVHRAEDPRVLALGREAGLLPVANDRPEAGMARSLQLGLEALAADPGMEAVGWALIVLGDQPLLRHTVIAWLAEATHGGADLVRPGYSEASSMPGHPVLLRRRVWPLAARLTGDQGFGHLPPGSLAIETVPVPGRNPDVDTPADLAGLDPEGDRARGA